MLGPVAITPHPEVGRASPAIAVALAGNPRDGVDLHGGEAHEGRDEEREVRAGGGSGAGGPLNGVGRTAGAAGQEENEREMEPTTGIEPVTSPVKYQGALTLSYVGDGRSRTV